MGLLNELRTRVRSILGPLFGLCLVAYFTFHLINGERGLIAWIQVRQYIDVAKDIHTDLAAQRRKIEHRIGLMRNESLDPDLLDEQARFMLNLGRPDEIVIFPDVKTAIPTAKP